MASNHIVFIVMDSCRYDSMMAAATPNIDRLGQAEKRYSYASWTAPSHYAFTMGLMPHSQPEGRVRLRDLQGGVHELEGAHRRGRGDVQRLPARDLAAQGAEQARLSHGGQGLDAGAQQVHADQQALRRVQADEPSQRLRDHGRGDGISRRRASVLLPESRRDPLSLHALRRRPAAHLGRARRDQVDRQGRCRRRRRRSTRRSIRSS